LAAKSPQDSLSRRRRGAPRSRPPRCTSSRREGFPPFLTRIKEANPDLIFAAGYYNEAALIVRQAKELGIKVQILAEEGFDSPKFIELAGKDAEGVIIATNLDRDDPRPVVQNFLKSYKAAYKIDPDMVGASSYDAFMILVNAIDARAPPLPRLSSTP